MLKKFLTLAAAAAVLLSAPTAASVCRDGIVNTPNVIHGQAEIAPGVHYHYVTAGPQDGLPVVLVHGWPDLWIGWKYQFEMLAKKYRVIAVDVRGFGESYHPKDESEYGTKKLTDDLVGVLDWFKIPKAVFLGHDWGGAMVWRMPMFHPDRVIALSSTCTPYAPVAKEYVDLQAFTEKNPTLRYQRIMADSENTAKLLDANVERFMTAMYRRYNDSNDIVTRLREVGNSTDRIYTERSEILTKQELDCYVEQYKKTGFRPGLNYYRTRKIDFESEKNLTNRIDHPTLFIAANNDDILTPKLGEITKLFVKNLRYELVDKAGHWILREQKDRVNEIMSSWMEEVVEPLVAKEYPVKKGN